MLKLMKVIVGVMKLSTTFIEGRTMTTQYEIRTMRGTPVQIFDDEVRARAEMLKQERRVGIKMQLYKIVSQEELMA
jgi:CRISPR/Cas system CMR-associated protein Cmr3 (group 5 of RAMP superfamily)